MSCFYLTGIDEKLSLLLPACMHPMLMQLCSSVRACMHMYMFLLTWLVFIQYIYISFMSWFTDIFKKVLMVCKAHANCTLW